MAEDNNGFEVGYGKPPAHTRFRKGQSGNLKGRPKGVRNMHSLVDAELGQRITIRENGNSRRVTKKEALIKNLVNSAIKGQVAALKALIPLITDTETANALADQRKTLSRDDAEILDAALARLGVQRKQNSDPEDEESKDG